MIKKLIDWSHWIAVAILVAVISVIAHYRIQLADTKETLAKQSVRMYKCLDTLEEIEDLTKELQAQKEKNKKEVAKAKQETEQELKKLRQRPVENTLESIKTEGLQTAKEALRLWKQ